MKKLAFLFPGQGSQYVGMGKSLFESEPVARAVFEEANDALGFDIASLCFNGDINELTKTENTQPAILTASVAAFRVFMKKFGVEPSFLAGHSLGEFSALTCAGAMSFADAVRTVKWRGRFMQEAVPYGIGSMAAVSGVNMDVIEEQCRLCSDESYTVVISNYNSLQQIVISGHAMAVSNASEKLKQLGAIVIPLKVSAPFHSPLMQPAADRLKEEMQKISYSPIKWEVVSNVTAVPYTGQHEIVDTLALQIIKAVRWTESMKYLETCGVEMVIELGPQTVLKNLMKKNSPKIATFSFDRQEDEKAIEDELLLEAKVSADAQMKLRLITRCIAAAVCTKNNNWDNEEYTKGVIVPYRKVKNMQEELENGPKEPGFEHMKEALSMLKSVFVTKKTPPNEQNERLDKIFEETGMKGLFIDMNLYA